MLSYYYRNASVYTFVHINIKIHMYFIFCKLTYWIPRRQVYLVILEIITFNFFIVYWSVNALQFCVSFCCTTVNQLYVYMYLHPVESPSHLPSLLGHHRALSWAFCTIYSFPLAIYLTHGSVYISMLLSQFVPSSLSPPCPYAHSLCRCLYSCPENRFICIPLLYSIRMWYHMIFVFLFFWLISLCVTDPRSIHVPAKDPISFLAMAE